MLKDKQTINDLCLNCTRPTCNGVCDEVVASMGKPHKNGAVTTITWHGITRTVSEWADILGISRQALYSKLHRQTSFNDIFMDTFQSKHPVRHSGSFTEEVYSRLSMMHTDYKIYWETPLERHASLGMVTNYNKIQSSPTNKITNVVETIAIPEAMLSDDIIERRSWIALVLYMIGIFQMRKDKYHQTGDVKAFILEQRALKGKPIKAILEEYNHNSYHNFTIVTFRRFLSEIVDDIINEALKRGLLLEPQK